jgi:hypothetical protein
MNPKTMSDGRIALTLTLSRSWERGQLRTTRFGRSGKVMQSTIYREEGPRG